MIRLALRMLGWLSLAGGFVALVIDGTQTIAGDALHLTSLGAALGAIFGQRLAALQPMVERNLSPVLWNPVLTALLATPLSAALIALGVASALATGRQRPQIGVSSRL